MIPADTKLGNRFQPGSKFLDSKELEWQSLADSSSPVDTVMGPLPCRRDSSGRQDN